MRKLSITFIAFSAVFILSGCSLRNNKVTETLGISSGYDSGVDVGVDKDGSYAIDESDMADASSLVQGTGTGEINNDERI